MGVGREAAGLIQIVKEEQDMAAHGHGVCYLRHFNRVER